MLTFPQLKRLLAGRRLPLAFVDLDAFDRNVDHVASIVRPRGTPLRIASKSIRVVELLRRIQARDPVYSGIMCFSVEEAAHLHREGFDDLLVAYPAFQLCDVNLAADLASGGAHISLMADCTDTVDRIGSAARARDTEVQVVLCVDMSLEIGRGHVHLGVRRSPLHDPRDVVKLARHVAATDGTRFHGFMGYEAQVAGLGDANPFEPLLNPVKAWVRRASMRELSTRRRAIVAALSSAGLAPRLVNGGGTGSLDWTTPRTGITEVTAGSAFLKPHLFDHFSSPHMSALEPACFFALEATRKPRADMVTCLGGGYVASGPPGRDKIPQPWLPEGIKLVSEEMCGEVQTPVQLRSAGELDLGDPVVFRHAKGGELAERFSEYLLIEGGEVVTSAPTYRGQGQCFF